MLLEEYIETADLVAAIELGYINVNSHPDYPDLRLYTYARTAQFDSYWTDATRKCRGLITDRATGEIVAFCMPKFFNKSEHDNGKSYAAPIPADQSVRIFDKMDGSMGTVYFYADEWHVATKGSFMSDQAVAAAKMLRSADTRYLIPGMTYVVEIIYPENRIVVDYGRDHDLVLLTSFLPDGREVLVPESWEKTGFSYVGEYTAVDDWETITDHEVSGTRAEGYVVRFESGLRVKMKYAEYLALHKILTNCTERTIWEALYNRNDLSEFKENVPDEFDEWVENTVYSIKEKVTNFELAAENYFMTIVYKVGVSDRKKFAMEAAKLDGPLRSAMFMLYDGKSVRELAYKQCYPSAVRTFRQEGE